MIFFPIQTYCHFLNKIYVCNIYSNDPIQYLGSNMDAKPHRVININKIDYEQYKCWEFEITNNFTDFNFIGKFGLNVKDTTKYQKSYPGVKVYLHEISQNAMSFVAPKGFSTKYKYIDYGDNNDLLFDTYKIMQINRNGKLFGGSYVEINYQYYKFIKS